MIANAGDAVRRAYLGRNNASLADLFAAPDSVERIRAIAARWAETPFVDAFMRGLVQYEGAQ